MKLLPVDMEAAKQNEDDEDASAAKPEKREADAPMNFEPEDEEALNLIIPKYISSLIYGALISAQASENGDGIPKVGDMYKGKKVGSVEKVPDCDDDKHGVIYIYDEDEELIEAIKY
jgi:hypothetical protein